MNGLRIIINGADFSALNKGKAGVENLYFTNGSVADTTKQAAFSTFLNGLVAYGLADKLDYARIFFNTGLSDRLNIIDPRVSIPAHMGEFVLDDSARHTKNGWKGALGGAFLYSNYRFSAGNVPKMHCHVFQTEAESNNNASLFALVLDPASFPGNDIWFQLSKSSTGVIKSIFEKQSTVDSFLTGAGAPTGLVSFSSINGINKIYDAGVLLNQENQTSVPFVTGEQSEVAELWGGGNPSTGVGVSLSQSRVFFTAVGTKDWTDQDEANLNSLLLSFRAAL
jgi:hypothetical protein